MPKAIALAARAGAIFPASVRSLIWDRNRAVILLFAGLWGVGASCVAIMTILPGYLDHLGVSKSWIGVLPALQLGLPALLQLVAAHRARPGKKRVRGLSVCYIVTGLTYFLLGLLILNLALPVSLAVGAALLAVMIASIATGMGDPRYLAAVVESVEPQERGRYFGLRTLAFSAGGMAGGVLAAWILRAASAPHNFGWSFLAGGVLIALSVVFWQFFRPHEAASEIESPPEFRAFLSERILPWLRHREFRAFLMAFGCYIFATGIFPFLSLWIQKKLRAPDEIFGLLGGIAMAGSLLFSWGLGAINDRYGPRQSLTVAMLIFAVGLMGCWLGQNAVVLFSSYWLASIYLAALFIPISDLALRIAHGARVEEVWATKTVMTAPAQIGFPILIGASLDHYPFAPILISCAIAALLSAVIVWRCVASPPPK